MQLSIKGKGEKNLQMDYKHDFKLNGSAEIEAEFFVDKISSESDAWKTQPAIVSEISINGKLAIFKTGIESKFPFTVNLLYNCYHLHREQEAYLNVSNNYKEKAEFQIQFPENENMKAKKNPICFSLESKEKKSVGFNVTIDEPQIIHE